MFRIRMVAGTVSSFVEARIGNVGKVFRKSQLPCAYISFSKARVSMLQSNRGSIRRMSCGLWRSRCARNMWSLGILSRNVHAGVTARDCSVVRNSVQTLYCPANGAECCARGGRMEEVVVWNGLGLGSKLKQSRLRAVRPCPRNSLERSVALLHVFAPHFWGMICGSSGKQGRSPIGKGVSSAHRPTAVCISSCLMTRSGSSWKRVDAIWCQWVIQLINSNWK